MLIKNSEVSENFIFTIREQMPFLQMPSAESSIQPIDKQNFECFSSITWKMQENNGNTCNYKIMKEHFYIFEICVCEDF